MSDAPTEAAELQARIAAARARTSATEAARPDPMIASLRVEAEAAERAALNAEAITRATCELGAEGRHFLAVDTDQGVIIVKRPHSAVFRRFSDLDAPKHLDVEQLVKPCVTHPDRSRLDTMLEEQPAILNRLALAVGRLAGARAQDLAGK